MKVSEIMTPEARCVGPDTSIVTAAEIMRELDVGGLPVCDHGRLAGMITDRDIALRVAAQLAEIGVRAIPRAVEWATFQQKHREGDFDAFVASRIVGTRVDLEGFTTGASQNHAGYANAELDALASKAAMASTLEEAGPLWAKAQQIILRDQPVTFLFEQDRLYAVRRRIRDVTSGPLGLFGGLRLWKVEALPSAAPTGRSDADEDRSHREGRRRAD